jgi:probable phosphoglycerate mutase
MSRLPGTDARRRIYLMRHGHVDYLNRTVVESGAIHDVSLTPRGRLQAEAAGRAFQHVAFDRAICSGYPRTRETAELVLSCLPKPPPLEIEPALVEILPGKERPPVKSRAELIEQMNSYFARAHEKGAKNFSGGELFAEAQARAVAAIERLIKEPGWHTILVVAHEGINRLVLSWATGAGLHAVSAFQQDTGCINVLDFDLAKDGSIARPIIKAVNLTPYNYLKHGMNLTSLEAIFERDANEREPG